MRVFCVSIFFLFLTLMIIFMMPDTKVLTFKVKLIIECAFSSILLLVYSVWLYNTFHLMKELQKR